MRKYESVYILDPALDNSVIEDKIGRFNETITSHGGKILKQDKWGSRNLAYPIAKKTQGFYVVTVFEGEGKTLSELERAYKLEEQLLRHLTVVLDKKHLKAFEKATRVAAPA